MKQSKPKRKAKKPRRVVLGLFAAPRRGPAILGSFSIRRGQVVRIIAEINNL